MRKLFTAISLIALVAAVAAAPLWAESHSFKLNRDASLNGAPLKAGNYKLQLDGGGEAVIFQGKQEVARGRVEVKPLTTSSASGSVMQGADGAILEIRLNKKVVVFVR